MDEALENRVGELLRAHGLTVAAAESCTGGLILHRLTNIAGSSAYVLGGAVTYSNAAKMSVLGVREATLIDHGAVSAPVAAEMAAGVRQLLGASVAVSVTGIAGPGGGTPTKPVGLTFIGLSAALPPVERVERYVWAGDRLANKQQSADAALRLLITYLEALP
jgi:PncC family amidohydrolase